MFTILISEYCLVSNSPICHARTKTSVSFRLSICSVKFLEVSCRPPFEQLYCRIVLFQPHCPHVLLMIFHFRTSFIGIPMSYCFRYRENQSRITLFEFSYAYKYCIYSTLNIVEEKLRPIRVQVFPNRIEMLTFAEIIPRHCRVLWVTNENNDLPAGIGPF